MKEQLAKAEAGVAKLLETRNDRWYPSFHIASAAGWINDPNGLSYFNGRYQVYFQHHPFGTTHGPMHWGHVSSEDMVTWRREPIAFAPSIPADRDGVYSGSAVVSDDGKTQYIYYTGNRETNYNENPGTQQDQCLATSIDGVTFEKQGVVIESPAELSDFRDPKVWKMVDTWYMVFGVRSPENRGQVWLYTSKDMLKWEFDQILFEDPDPNVFMLECPDLFPVGDKWVIAYGPMGPDADGYVNRNGCNSGYVLGDWAPGQKFVQTQDYLPGDWGHNFYAPQSFEAPDGRRIQYGWLGAFTEPLASQAEDSWCGQLTLPRVLTLSDDGALLSNPIEEITKLRLETEEFGAFEVGRNERFRVSSDAEVVEIEVEVELARHKSQRRPDRFGFEVHKTADGHHSYVYYDDLVGRVGIDQRLTYTGERGYRAGPVSGDVIKLRIFIDRGSIEVYANDGESTVTSFSFPGEGPRAIELVSENAPVKVRDLKVHKLGAIWAEPDR